jgi:hypothetical protein
MPVQMPRYLASPFGVFQTLEIIQKLCLSNLNLQRHAETQMPGQLPRYLTSPLGAFQTLELIQQVCLSNLNLQCHAETQTPGQIPLASYRLQPFSNPRTITKGLPEQSPAPCGAAVARSDAPRLQIAFWPFPAHSRGCLAHTTP